MLEEIPGRAVFSGLASFSFYERGFVLQFHRRILTPRCVKSRAYGALYGFSLRDYTIRSNVR